MTMAQTLSPGARHPQPSSHDEQFLIVIAIHQMILNAFPY